MNTNDAVVELELADWEARSIHVRGEPVEISAVEGELLVTLEGDPADHILGPGERFVAQRRGRLVVAALGPSRVRVARQPAPAPTFRLPRRTVLPGGAMLLALCGALALGFLGAAL
jgi:DUF2917 family protein